MSSKIKYINYFSQYMNYFSQYMNYFSQFINNFSQFIMLTMLLPNLCAISCIVGGTGVDAEGNSSESSTGSGSIIVGDGLHVL